MRDTFLMTLVGLSVIYVVGLVAIAERQWQRRRVGFAEAHESRVVERMPGAVDTAVAPIFDNRGGVSYAVGVTGTRNKTVESWR
jgi:hypothetical protein